MLDKDYKKILKDIKEELTIKRTKEEALEMLFSAGLVTRKCNHRKPYDRSI